MPTRTILTTQRFRLRTWRHSDAPAYQRHCNTPEVMQHLGGVMTPRQLRLEVAWLIRHQEREGLTFWAMERKKDQAFLGFCGLIRVNEPNTTVNGKIEVGWRVRSDMWRKGYAYEAAQAVLEYGHEHYAEQIVSRVAPGNVASRGLMHKLGLQRLSALDYVDHRDHLPLIVYGL
jgi:RimJ/RimL family protein N-acetyltransferase